MVQSPDAMAVTVLPETVHFEVVVDVKTTVRELVAEALND
jgi:hypothetical protein